jgi:hypothetical protein
MIKISPLSRRFMKYFIPKRLSDLPSDGQGRPPLQSISWVGANDSVCPGFTTPFFHISNRYVGCWYFTCV